MIRRRRMPSREVRVETANGFVDFEAESSLPAPVSGANTLPVRVDGGGMEGVHPQAHPLPDVGAHLPADVNNSSPTKLLASPADFGRLVIDAGAFQHVNSRIAEFLEEVGSHLARGENEFSVTFGGKMFFVRSQYKTYEAQVTHIFMSYDI